MGGRGPIYPSKTIQKYVELEIHRICAGIQKKRKERGFTQEEFAERINISPTTIKFIEQGRRAPSIQMLLLIVRELDLELEMRPRSRNKRIKAG